VEFRENRWKPWGSDAKGWSYYEWLPDFVNREKDLVIWRLPERLRNVISRNYQIHFTIDQFTNSPIHQFTKSRISYWFGN